MPKDIFIILIGVNKSINTFPVYLCIHKSIDMAKSNNKRKKAAKPSKQLSPQQYLKQKVSQLPKGKWYINADWQTAGLAVISAVRIMPSGNIVYGTYLVDVFCLGVKDAGYRFNLNALDAHDEIMERYEHMDLEAIEINPDYAHNIIYGAIEYAAQFKFAPKKDFDLAEYILDPADEIPFMDIEFGKNGKPFYISGPHDNVNLILHKLNITVGEGNYESLIRLGGSYDEFDVYDDEEDEDYDDEEDEDGEYIDYEEVDGPDK